MRRAAPPLAGTPCAFTLVEVVMALGIFTFALVSMVGLLPVSLKSARQAIEITHISKMVAQVGSELSQGRFADAADSVASHKVWTFDYEGIGTSVASESYYRISADGAPNLTLPGATAASGNILRVTLTPSTRSGTILDPTVITIPDMGY